MKRLFSYSVSRQQQRLLARVPESEGKHAVQQAYTGRAEFFIGMNQNLGIRPGVKLVAPLLKIVPQGSEVVDFPIKDYPHRTIFIVNGLMTGDEIDNAEPPDCKTNWSLGIYTTVVRPTMNHGVTHPKQHVLIDRTVVVEVQNPGYGAHRFTQQWDSLCRGVFSQRLEEQGHPLPEIAWGV